MGAETEEAEACLRGLRQARELRIPKIVVESDCLAVVNKLKHPERTCNIVGMIVEEIRLVLKQFDFFSVSHIRRGVTRLHMHLQNSSHMILIVENGEGMGLVRY